MTRVLIVDDHPEMCATLVRLLSRAADVVVCGTADSGEGALVLAITLAPDVVLMDRAMPGMGGIAATRAIVEAMVPCRVLLLSGDWTTDQCTAAREAGASAVMFKGGEPVELLTVVRALAPDPTR